MSDSTQKSASKMNDKWDVKYARYIFIILSWVFVICVVAQVFIAGLATFLDPSNWRTHTNFIHIFEFLPVIMFLLSFPVRLPKTIRWQSLGLFGLIFLQYATAHLGSVWVLAALHPVIALVLFWGSISVAKKSIATIRGLV